MDAFERWWRENRVELEDGFMPYDIAMNAWMAADMLGSKRRARRERIATACLVALIGSENETHKGQLALIPYAVKLADTLAAELDRKE